jgi:NAD-dependent dihydropyrimidine dehydrogenase PreA subunit
MAKVKRQVIKIDEELCNGCGNCVPSCAEGAIRIIDGKARLVSDKYCDGLGACLGECPMGALGFEEREADEFDEVAVGQHLKSIGRESVPHAHDHLHAAHAAPAPAMHGHHHGGGGCPSAKTLDFRTEERKTSVGNGNAPKLESELRQWPVKIYLVNPSAPYFQDADLLIAADCTPFAYASLHPDFLKGKAVVIGCPKFDDLSMYLEKLTAIISQNNIKSVTVLHMEVPCCFGMMNVAREAVAASGKELAVEAKVVTLRGEIEEPKGVASLF